MKGILVTNGFVRWEKFETIYKMLIDAFNGEGCELMRYSNIELMKPVNADFPCGDFVLFWDKDVMLAKRLEKRGMRVFNSSEALETCDNKGLTAVVLENSGIKMPQTILLPKTFAPYSDYEFVSTIGDTLGFPLVLKECHGSFGKQVWLINNIDELIEKIREVTPRPMIAQKLISTSFGRDVRIQVVGGEIVAAAYRKAKDGDFIANVTSGGTMYDYKPTKEQAEMAINACRAVKADFAGVDVLFGKDEEPVLCEINTNAHFKNLYDATGIDASLYIAKHIVSVIKNG